jgi:hypothetical protein
LSRLELRRQWKRHSGAGQIGIAALRCDDRRRRQHHRRRQPARLGEHPHAGRLSDLRPTEPRYFRRRLAAVTRPTVAGDDAPVLQFDCSSVQVADIEVPASACAASVASAETRFAAVTELQLGSPATSWFVAVTLALAHIVRSPTVAVQVDGSVVNVDGSQLLVLVMPPSPPLRQLL